MDPSAIRVAHLFRQGRQQCFYDGPPLEEGRTSITNSTAPYVRKMGKDITPGMKILDYGAGQIARNGDYFRGLGAKVYAYDPFHSTGGDGWEMGSVTQRMPRGKFDLVFTCYVLNVVPKEVERSILKNCLRFSKGQVVHITRNKDIEQMARGALGRGDPLVTGFVNEWFIPQCAPHLASVAIEDWTDADYVALCAYGVATRQGFQRIPYLEHEGYAQPANNAKYKAYKRG